MGPPWRAPALHRLWRHDQPAADSYLKAVPTGDNDLKTHVNRIFAKTHSRDPGAGDRLCLPSRAECVSEGGGARLRTYVRYYACSDRRSRDGFRWPIESGDTSDTLFGEFGLERHIGRGEYRGLEFLHVNARTIINRVPASSRMSFEYTINAYRGCSHACTYCFARPTHEFLGLGMGEDFERRIVVKVNAVERARAEVSSARWHGDLIAMGTDTDPYQHAEGKYHLTRGIIEVLGERRNPFSILTKSTLVLRDLSVLSDAARHTSVRVNLSVGTLDREVWRLTEPGTPPPDKRLDAVRRLNEAGIPCGVLVAPVLPGLSDGEEQITAVVEACREARAVGVTAVALHLRPGVREHYLAWLTDARPDLAGLYAQRFGRGSYQPRREQERLSALVASVLQKGQEPTVGRPTGRRASRSMVGEPTEMRAAHEEVGGPGPEKGLARRPPRGPTAGTGSRRARCLSTNPTCTTQGQAEDGQGAGAAGLVRVGLNGSPQVWGRKTFIQRL